MGLGRMGNYIFSLGLDGSAGEDRGRVKRMFRAQWIISFSDS